MYYIIYETTNLINGKKYRGAHHTKKIEDGYLGSGKALKRAIKKYGKENFKRSILKFCSDMKSMFEDEKEYVNKEWMNDKNTYNMMLGGFGGGSFLIGKMPARTLEGNTIIVNVNDPRILSGELVHNTKGRCVVKDKDGNIFQTLKDDTRIQTGELQSITKGKTIVKDKDGLIY